MQFCLDRMGSLDAEESVTVNLVSDTASFMWYFELYIECGLADSGLGFVKTVCTLGDHILG